MSKLMEKPEESNLKYKEKNLFLGKDLEDCKINSIYHDWCRFHFPQGVKNKIEKEKLYKVWFDYSDSSDPANSSCHYTIYYIEEAPEEIKIALEMWETNEKIVKNYLKKA